MKKKLLRVILFCFCIGTLGGCNQEEIIGVTQEYQNLDSVAGKKEEKINAPETESFEMVSESGRTTVKVLAQVIVPEVEKIPVAKMVKKEFSTMDLKWLVEQIVDKGNKIQYARGYDQMTKEELMKQMEKQRNYLEKMQQSNEYSDDDKKIVQKEVEKSLLKLQEYLENAPDKVDQVPVLYKLTKNKKKELMGIEVEEFFVQGEVNGESVWLYVEQGKDYNSVEYTFNKDESTFQGYFNGYKSICLYDEKEAKVECENFLGALGIKQDFSLVEVYPTKENIGDFYSGYQLIYKRKINGIVETYDGENVKNSKDYEEIVFKFGRLGMTSFCWKEPMIMDKIVVEDVEMISYDRIIENFKEKGFSKSKVFSNEEKKNNIHDVGKIVLGLMRVSNPQNLEEFSLIPVWDFYNTENEMLVKSYLTINAIDGSIIDRKLGY